jgi:hypothetical protein
MANILIVILKIIENEAVDQRIVEVFGPHSL